MAEYEENPKKRPPLGLPVGSVRALLTLLTVGVVTRSVALGRELDVLWKKAGLLAEVGIAIVGFAGLFERVVRVEPDPGFDLRVAGRDSVKRGLHQLRRRDLAGRDPGQRTG